MRLLIDGGDGDQTYFSNPLTLESETCAWFDADTPRGAALLFKITSGKHRGEYVALTSRVKAGLEDQLKTQGSASVIVNVIRQVGSEYRPTLENLDAVGMAFADVVS